jgi:hypothetical protein
MNSSSLDAKKKLFPPGVRVEYRAMIESKAMYLPNLVDLAVKELISPSVLTGNPIIDLKGRDQRNLIDDSGFSAMAPTGDEFCFIGGKIGLRSPRDLQESFSLSLLSRYVESPDNAHIAHVCEIDRRNLPEFVPIEKIGRAVPLHIQVFRLGFDVFQRRFMSSFLGTVPTATQTLLLEADEKKCLISIIADGLKSKADPVLQKAELGARLQRVVKKALGFDFESDYRSKL